MTFCYRKRFFQTKNTSKGYQICSISSISRAEEMIHIFSVSDERIWSMRQRKMSNKESAVLRECRGRVLILWHILLTKYIIFLTHDDEASFFASFPFRASYSIFFYWRLQYFTFSDSLLQSLEMISNFNLILKDETRDVLEVSISLLHKKKESSKSQVSYNKWRGQRTDPCNHFYQARDKEQVLVIRGICLSGTPSSFTCVCSQERHSCYLWITFALEAHLCE
jgi:hypothetical protein